MISGKSTEESVKLLRQKRNALINFEKRIAEGEQQATLNKLHNMHNDYFNDYPESNINCGCDGANSKAYSAYPNDSPDTLLACIDCGQIWRLKGKKNKVSQEKYD